MKQKYILALDQGTTSSRAIVFNQQGKIIGLGSQEIRQIYPKPGWVEHDPIEIWASQMVAVKKALDSAHISATQLAAVGITNQRETTILWDRQKGKPVYNAIVWQCRRSAEQCSRLKQSKFAQKVHQKTGLMIDAYFSGTKVQWILEHNKKVRQAAWQGDIAFGTVDSWLAYQLSGKKLHITDYANASRTLLFNIHDLSWDKDILNFLGIPTSILPQVKPSSHFYGYTSPEVFFDTEVPISGIIGDQQGALFGQTCFNQGQSKNTYGTGCFLLMHTGKKPVESQNKLLTTISWGLSGKVEYALEGSIFIAGAAVQWLRDGLQIIAQAKDSESMAASLNSNEGVYFVPAFVGLGAPYWDMYARGAILGLTRGTTKAHIARATLEAIAYQTKDVLECMERDAGIKLKELRADGGATANSFLMQFQADILGVPVVVPEVAEVTSLGAAYLAGLAVGYWKDKQELSRNFKIKKKYIPRMPASQRKLLYERWQLAVARTGQWAVEK
ncbi:MAG: glycerol kinase GlpK [Thermodesulfobacteriota bacterium]